MRKIRLSAMMCTIAVLSLISGCTNKKDVPTPPETETGEKSDITSFVTVQGDELVDENGPLRFISYNIPCLHYNEDYLPFHETNAWRFPDEFEIRDALEAVRQMGGQVVRTYTLSVRKADDTPDIPRHVQGPGEFNEEAFVALDKVLQIANEKQIRLIIPFVNNWQWWGGIAEYAGFRNKPKKEFWTDEEIFEDFKKTIYFVLNRKNTFTGIRYKDDPAVLGWQLGNELQCPHEWTVKTAAYIKSLDQNHLVIDGPFTDKLYQASIDAPEIDVVTTHHYSPDPDETIRFIKDNKARTKGKKPYFVGEFGFLPTKDILRILDTVIETHTSGALIWSLRKRNRDGGFYWHSEPLGGDLYKAYHWPGFESGNSYDETNLLKLMRPKAFEIRGLAVPEITPPASPVLLPISDVSAISWQGSVGASSYTIQRSLDPQGPWETLDTNIDDAWVQYRPLYNDTSAEPGNTYYYRILAQNAAGKSEASNSIGPVYAPCRTLVDEMVDMNQIYKSNGTLSLQSNEARRFKEDLHRLKGDSDAFVIYKLPKPISTWQVYTFFEDKISDLQFEVSKDGLDFNRVEVNTKLYFSNEGSYGYCKPIEYQGRVRPQDGERYLKINFTGTAHISRVRITYDQMEDASSPVSL